MNDLGPATSASPTNELLTETELAVATLWTEVLQMAELPGATDNFFALGGHSMTMVMVEFRIMEELGVQLPAGTMLSAPTVREISALIDAQRERPTNFDSP